MTAKEREQRTRDLVRGLEVAEYRMLKEKAIRGQVVVQGDDNGGYREVPARELFAKLYHEAVPAGC